MILIAAVLVGLIPIIPAVIYFFQERKTGLTRATRGLILGINGFNGILLLMAAGLVPGMAGFPLHGDGSRSGSDRKC